MIGPQPAGVAFRAVVPPDGTIAASTGGTVFDETNAEISISAGAGLVPSDTGVFIDVLGNGDIVPPAGLGPGGTLIASIRLDPDPGILAVPGVAIRLPLREPMPRPTRLALFKLEANGTLLDLGIIGQADATGTTATFEGIRSAFTFVGFEIPNQPPVVSAGGPYVVGEGGTVLLTGTATDVGDQVTYAWDLDGDGVFESAGASVSFSAAGLDGPLTRSVSLRVTDGGGLSTVVSTTVTVLNVAPVITAMAVTPPQAAEGEIATFAISFTDGSASDTHTITWDFGDGTPPVSGSTSIGHRYASSGTFTAAVTVTDHQGATATRTMALAVRNVAPTVTSVTNTGPVNLGAPVTVTVSATDATPNDVLTYHFDFDGDGVFEIARAEPVATFTYAHPGVYTVGVEVRDEAGVARGATVVTVNQTFVLTVLPPSQGRNTADGSSAATRRRHAPRASQRARASRSRSRRPPTTRSSTGLVATPPTAPPARSG